MSNLNDNKEVVEETSSLSLDETIFKEVVNALYMALPASTAANSIIGLSLISILWHVIDTTLLVVWFLVLFTISIGRYILYRRYMKARKNTSLDLLYWDRFIFY